MDPRVEKVAEVMVNYSVAIQPGDLVMIHLYEPLAQPLALAVYKRVLEAGGHVIFRMAPSGADEVLYKYASDEQLDVGDPTFKWLMENIDVRIAIRAPSNTKALSNVDPAKIARVQKANHPAMQAFMERQGTGEMRWVLTQYPTQASAQDAEMSLSEYEDFVYGACMVNEPDPVAYWQQKSAEQQRLIDWLKGKEQMQVRGENIDLTLSIKDRVFINADGKRNFPDGEIYTGPVEDSVNGWVRFTYPAIYNSREVNGVELYFENGRSSRRPPRRVRSTSTACSTPMRALATWASLPSARTRGSRSSRGTYCSTRRSAGRSTWPLAQATPTPARRTSRRCTGI